MVVVPICGPLKSPGLGPGEIDSQNVPTERRAVHSKRREKTDVQLEESEGSLVAGGRFANVYYD
jgi:hypothetical protein